MKIKLKEIIQEGFDDMEVANALASLSKKIDEDRADRIVGSWKQNASLGQMQKYWKAVKAKNFKSIAKIIKKDWKV